MARTPPNGVKESMNKRRGSGLIFVMTESARGDMIGEYPQRLAATSLTRPEPKSRP